MYENKPWEPVYQEPPKVTAVYKASSLEEKVYIPALKSAFLGFTAGVFFALLSWVIEWPNISPWLIFPLVWFLVMPIVFYLSSENGVYLIERISGADLNGDGWRGRPGETIEETPPGTKYLTPVWVHDDPENKANSRIVDLPAPKDDTLERMAVILAARGWTYFTCDNFTNAKSETQLMSYDHWQEVFLPAMVAARLVSTTTDSLNRKRVELTEMGKQMFLKLAGALDRAALPVGPVVYAQDASTPLTRSNLSRSQNTNHGRQTDRKTDRQTAKTGR